MIPPVSPFLWRWFSRYGRWYVRRHFHAVRISRESPSVPTAAGPLIVIMNHPSWWDPMIALILANHFWPDRRHYAPIDAAALGKYAFFGKLGFFGVQQDTPRGAAAFLRTSCEILAQRESVVWITAEGAFTDPRRRPVQLRPGVAHLVKRVPGVTILPLAIEYAFWQSRLPEVLVGWGDPIAAVQKGSLNAPAWNGVLEQAMRHTQDVLAERVISREPAMFDTLLSGAGGVAFWYDWWRRLRAGITGKPFQREHGDT